MNKTIIFLLLMLTLAMNACRSNNTNVENPVSSAERGPASGDLSAPMLLAIGTIQLNETEHTVSAEQAAQLLPLWQTLQVLYSSDTTADQEVEALITQIQETMTEEQTQAIAALNLTRQDMMSIMQSQGMTMGGAQNGSSSGTGTSNNSADPVRPGGGGFAGGPPPDGGGFPDGGPNFQGQGNRPEASDSTTTQPAAINPDRIPPPLVQAVIEYLKKQTDQT
jgi:hypothetical protein